MQDAWRAYLEVALGLTEASRKKAREVTKNLFDRGEATAAQLQDAASELLATSRGNRETLGRLVRYEVDRALGALGLATSEEVTELTERVRELEREMYATAGVAVPGTPAKPAVTQPDTVSASKKTAPKKTIAKKTTAKKVPAKQTTAKQTTAKKAPAKQTTAKGTTAKKAPKATKKTVAQKGTTAGRAGSAGAA